MASESWQLDRLAFIQYALLQAGAGDLASAESLFEVRDQLSPWAEALLMLTLEQLSPGSQEARTLASDLESTAIRSSTGVHWEEASPSPQNMTTPADHQRHGGVRPGPARSRHTLDGRCGALLDGASPGKWGLGFDLRQCLDVDGAQPGDQGHRRAGWQFCLLGYAQQPASCQRAGRRGWQPCASVCAARPALSRGSQRVADRAPGGQRTALLHRRA